MRTIEEITPIRWEEETLWMLDQRLLPSEEVWIKCPDSESVARGIEEMVIRGAPAIGIAAAFGMFLAIRDGENREKTSQRLAATRPTAVNLFWAIERMQGLWNPANPDPQRLEREAITIWEEDVRDNRIMGDHGAALLTEAHTVMTICNAGALATGGYGTALGVIRSAWRENPDLHVVVPETRPYLQGARLTAWELVHDGIKATVITDNMVGWWMKSRGLDAIVTGADRIAANGDTANKIGTYQMATLAKSHGVPFYVAAPISTLDHRLPKGSGIPIEERAEGEVKAFRGIQTAPDGVNAWHPAFDVTPASLITAIITQRGVHKPPFNNSLPSS